MKITVDKAPSPILQQKTPIKEAESSTDVDLTGKVKCEEIKLGNKLRYQIFVPEVNDVQIEKLESKGKCGLTLLIKGYSLIYLKCRYFSCSGFRRVRSMEHLGSLKFKLQTCYPCSIRIISKT